MKNLILILAVSFWGMKSYSQNNLMYIPPADTLPKIYLGFGTGVNNYVGLLGVGSDIRIYNRIFLRLGFGIGGWGYKFTGGIRYERKYKNGWGYGAGYSICSGMNDFKYDLETISGQSKIVKNVTLDLSQASTVNLTTFHNWFFKRGNKFYLEFGYSIPIETTPYKIKEAYTLSETSKAAMNFLQPGGIIFGLGFMFGL